MKRISIVTLFCTLIAMATIASASLLFYEGFDYADGAVMNDANQIGGWNANKDRDNNDPWPNTGDPMMVHDGDGGNGETWDGVFTSGAGGLAVVQSGNYAGVNPEVFDSDTSASQGASDHLFAFKALDSSVTSTFTDGSTTWFSFISYNKNRHALAAIGAGPLTGDRSRNSAVGEPAIGMGGRYNNGDARAHTWAGGAQYANGDRAGNATEMFFIAKIEWAAGGSNDTITMAAFADGATITEAAFDAATQSVLTADFDQSTFDTLTIGNQRCYVDEIRIATTFADAVTGLPPVTPSGTIIMLK